MSSPIGELIIYRAAIIHNSTNIHVLAMAGLLSLGIRPAGSSGVRVDNLPLRARVNTTPDPSSIMAHHYTFTCSTIIIISLFSYYIRQRSWANVMYSSPFVCLSVCLFVCLFVCLLAGLLKKLWTDLNEI